MNTKQVENDIAFDHDNKETITNVTFADQRPIQGATGQQADLPPSPNIVPDMKWYAAQQLEKPIIIYRNFWSVATTQGVVLADIDIPDFYTPMSSNIHVETLKMYSLFRGNPVIRIQLNGTKFHLGQLIAYWQPLRTHLFAPSNEMSSTGYPHVQLSAAGNDPVELELPFVHPQNYLATNSTNTTSLGRFTLRVLNQLRVEGSTVPSLFYTITLHWKNAEVAVPIYSHSILTAPIAEPMGLFNDISSFTTNATAAFAHAVTGNIRGVMSSGSKAMGMLLDRPTYILSPQKTITPYSALAHGKGADTSIRLGLDPGASVVKALEQFGGTEEEMTIKHVISTPMMFYRQNWSTQNGLLVSFPVSPLLCNPGPGLDSYPTFLAYIGQLYSYWRGSIKFRMDFISTAFHTGRLLIAFQPNDRAGPITLNAAMSCPYAVVDIQKTSRITFEVPFVSPTPYKVCTTLTDAPTTTGTVYVFVLNDLVMPDNVANNIDINFYISAGDDFKYFVPQDTAFHYQQAMAEPTGLFSNVQEGFTSGNDTSIVLGTGAPETSPNDFGENFDLSDYVKRYGLIRSLQTPGPIPNAPGYNAVVSTLPPMTNYFVPPVSAVLQIFACWYGSMRYKVTTDAVRTDKGLLTVSSNPNYISKSIGTPCGLPAIITNVCQDAGAEVELCPYTPYNFALTNYYANMRDQDNLGFLQIACDNAETKVSVYQAAGDDFQAFYLVAPAEVTGGQFYHPIIPPP